MADPVKAGTVVAPATAASSSPGVDLSETRVMTSEEVAEVDRFLDEAEAETAGSEEVSTADGPIVVTKEDAKPPAEPAKELKPGDEGYVAPEPPKELKPGDEGYVEPAKPELKPGDAGYVAPVEKKDELHPEVAVIEKPRNLSPKNESNWVKVTQLADKALKSDAEKTAKITELTTQLTQAQLAAKAPSAPADYEELKKFKSIFDLENDPEFKSKFDDLITESSETIYGILAKHQFPQAEMDKLRKDGIFSQSPKWWKENIIDKLEFTDAERIKSGLVELTNMGEKRTKELAKNAENRETYLTQQTEKKKQDFEAYQTEVTTRLQEIAKDTPWAQYREVPDSATPQQRQEVEAHNAEVTRLEGLFTEALYPKDAKTRADVAASAVAAGVIMKEYNALVGSSKVEKDALEAKIKALTDENSELKGAGRVPKPGPQGGATPPAAVDRSGMDPSKAIDETWAEVEGGE